MRGQSLTFCLLSFLFVCFFFAQSCDKSEAATTCYSHVLKYFEAINYYYYMTTMTTMTVATMMTMATTRKLQVIGGSCKLHEEVGGCTQGSWRLADLV